MAHGIAVIESKELRRYRLARVLSLVAVMALVVWLVSGSLVGEALEAAIASGAGPVALLAWALYALCVVLVCSMVPLLLHRVGSSRLYRSALERSTFPAEQGLTYWREALPDLRPACVSMLADLEVEPEKDAAAQLLRLEMQGLIRLVERDGVPVAEVVDQKAWDAAQEELRLRGNCEARETRGGSRERRARQAEGTQPKVAQPEQGSAVRGFAESDLVLVHVASHPELSAVEREARLAEWQRLEEEDAVKTPYFTLLPKRRNPIDAFGWLGLSFFLAAPIVAMPMLRSGHLLLKPDDPAFYQQFATAPWLLLELVVFLLLLVWFVLALFSGPIGAVGSEVGELVDKKERFARTEEGERLTELVFGLKNYVRDFTALSDAGRGAVAMWDDLLVYAVVLEENEQVVGQLLEERGLGVRWRHVIESLRV